VALLPTGAIRSKCLPAVMSVADEIQNDPKRMTEHLVSLLKYAPNVMQLPQLIFLELMFLILN
jgi:hypothetical protein